MKRIFTRLLGHDSRFSLGALFEYVTLCAVLLALSGLTGVMSSFFLMGMGLALGARQGLLAIALLTAAMLAAEYPLTIRASDTGFGRQFMVILVASGLTVWYLVRRRMIRETGSAGAPAEENRKSNQGTTP